MRFAASDLGLLWLLRAICYNTKDCYGNIDSDQRAAIGAVWFGSTLSGLTCLFDVKDK